MSKKTGPQPTTASSMKIGVKEKNPVFHRLRNWYVNFFDWYQLVPGRHQTQDSRITTKPTGWSQRISRWKEGKYPAPDVIARALSEQGFTLSLIIKPPQGITHGYVREATHADRAGYHARLDERLAFLDHWEGQFVKIEQTVFCEAEARYKFVVRRDENPHLQPFNTDQVSIPCIELIPLDTDTYAYLREKEQESEGSVA